MRYTKITGSFLLLAGVLASLALSEVFGKEGEAGDYIHYRLGVKYKREKNLDQAVEEFRKVLAAYPDNYNAYMHLAEIRQLQRQPRLVIYNLKKALTYNPGWGKAHRLLAVAYEKYGQYQNAVVELQLYQQTCDPAERDSVQTKINQLVDRLSGKAAPPPISASRPGVKAKPTGGEAARTGAPKAPRKASGAKSRSVSPERARQATEEFKMAVKLYGEGKLDESIEHVRKCLKLHPGHAGAYYYAGLVRRRNGQNKMAKINFVRAIPYPELGYNAHFYLGKIYAEEENYAEAVKHFRAYVAASQYEAGKEDARNLIEKYDAVLKGREKPKVEVDIRSIGEKDLRSEVERIEPQTAAAPIEVRIDKMLSMVMIDTITDLGQAMLKGVKLYKLGRYDDAVTEFRRVGAEHPTGEVPLHCAYNTGVCYLKMHLFEDAESQFRQVLDRFPSHELAAKSLFLEALSHFERKNNAVAEKRFRQFIRRHRAHPWVGKAYEKLGDAYADLEFIRKAAESYEHAVKFASDAEDKVYALYKLGVTYTAMDNADRALGAFRKAIDAGEPEGVYERVPDSYYRIADIHYRSKQYKEALNSYRTATRKYPGYPETPWGLFQTANIYKHTRQYQKAVDTYKELMKKHPDDYWARQARWKMEDTIWEHEYQQILR